MIDTAHPVNISNVLAWRPSRQQHTRWSKTHKLGRRISVSTFYALHIAEFDSSRKKQHIEETRHKSAIFHFTW